MDFNWLWLVPICYGFFAAGMLYWLAKHEGDINILRTTQLNRVECPVHPGEYDHDHTDDYHGA